MSNTPQQRVADASADYTLDRHSRGGGNPVEKTSHHSNKNQNPVTDHLDLWTSALLTKSTAGRGSNGKIEAYGIKKLRELILELAVRGKLVPQDPNDESANQALQKITAKRNLLIKEGKIKNLSKLPDVDKSEFPKNLPGGWCVTRLAEVLNVVNGRAYKKNEMLQNGTPLLRVGNLFTSNEWYYSDLKLESDKYIDTGDLIYAWSASFGPFIWNGGKVIYHYHIWKMDIFDETYIDKKYLFYYLKAITEEIKASGSGIAMIHMTKERMEKLILPVPPLEEQHRIVTKIDELMALCDQLEQKQTNGIAAHKTLVETLLGALTRVETAEEFTEARNRIANHFDTLFTTEQSIDQLKQTILQLAVMGKLVPQYPNDEPANVLLEKIAKEKVWLAKEGKIKSDKQATEMNDDNESYDLPVGWVWSDLSSLLALVTDGDHQAPPQTEEGVPFLVIGNINTGNIKLEGCKFVSRDYYEKLDWGRKPVNGDLLYTVTGSFGIPVPVETIEQFCVQRHVAILKSTNSTPRRYLSLVLCSRFAKKYATGIATGIAQKTVPLTGLRRMPIPVAPEKEQHRIVAKVDELMALCDTLKIRLNDASNTQIHLADAAVEKTVA